jgi:hypothetical protein
MRSGSGGYLGYLGLAGFVDQPGTGKSGPGHTVGAGFRQTFGPICEGGWLRQQAHWFSDEFGD